MSIAMHGRATARRISQCPDIPFPFTRPMEQWALFSHRSNADKIIADFEKMESK